MSNSNIMSSKIRGKFDRLGWKHYDIPVGICASCNHQIYRDEGYEKTSFSDSSGGITVEYCHKECPKHEVVDIEVITKKHCVDCGIKFEDSEGVTHGKQ